MISWTVRLGESNLEKYEDYENVQEFDILQIAKHPKYKQGIAYFDIAVLTIKPATFTKYVNPGDNIITFSR